MHYRQHDEVRVLLSQKNRKMRENELTVFFLQIMDS